jgi:membrane-bound serine protease (ClpP class)
MDILLDPNVAYLILMLGVLLTIMAILTPGTGILEIAAMFGLLLAGWTIVNLPTNWWALLLMLGAGGPLLVAARIKSNKIYLLIAVLFLLIGALFLYPGQVWWQPAVNPFLALIMSGLMGSFLWVAASKVLEAESVRPTHDLGSLIGQEGEVKSEIRGEGSVQVARELWTARSRERIPEGTRVRVVDREGFILVVEPVEEEAGKGPSKVEA